MTPDSLSSGALGVPPERTAEETDFVEWYVSAFGYFTHTPVSPERLIAGEILRLRASLAAVSEERDRLEKDHRLWALDNVARLPKRRECQCYRDDCVDCAKEIGRRIGHVEAGARESHEYAMRMLREFIAESRAALPVVEEPSDGR